MTTLTTTTLPVTTLVSAPLAGILERLFADAAASTKILRQEMADVSPEDLAAFMQSKTDYRAFYGRAKDYHLAVSRETATLLYLLARTSRARNIVEFGTSFGV